MHKYIAIVGTIAAGKTTAAKILENEHGYIHYKLSQGIYDEADRRGLDREDRLTLQNLGDELRATRGVSVLAKIVIDRIKAEGEKNKYVIESIRNHNELIELKNAFGDDLLIISIDAPLELRYERAVKREGQYKEHHLTLAEFKVNSDRDLGEGNGENEQNVIKCMKMADVSIENLGDMEMFTASIENLIVSF